MMNATNSKISDVVAHVRDMAEKYGFSPDEQTAEDAVKDSADLLKIRLTDEEVQQAVMELTER